MKQAQLRITLKAARVNADMSQNEVAEILTKEFGTKISRQRISNFEAKPANVPPIFGKALADIYGLPIDAISFA